MSFYPEQVWNCEFTHKRTVIVDSRRILSVDDVYTRQAHYLFVAGQIGSKTVQSHMEKGQQL